MWEYFCDESYYHMFAVRHTDDKSFNSAIHVGTEEEAQYLVNALTELDRLKNQNQ